MCDILHFVIEKIKKQYIIGKVLERRLMVGQEILVLFIMVRIRALQPKLKPSLVDGFHFGLLCSFDLKTSFDKQ